MKLIAGVDAQFARISLKRAGFGGPVPYRDFVDFLEQDGDEVIEIFAPAVRLPPFSSSEADIGKSYSGFLRYADGLRQQGVNVIEAPAKRAGDGVKHSDDQRLMIKLALTCMRLKPDFLILVAADGDYAPLVWGLREEGIRTKLITDPSSLAPELKAAAYSTSNIFNIVKKVTGPVDEPEVAYASGNYAEHEYASGK